jgi:hypothetical protein
MISREQDSSLITKVFLFWELPVKIKVHTPSAEVSSASNRLKLLTSLFTTRTLLINLNTLMMMRVYRLHVNLSLAG